MLFASGDSITGADLVPMGERSLRTDPSRPDWLVRHMVMPDPVFARAAAFDMIHFHVDVLQYPLTRRCATLCVTTLHGQAGPAGSAHAAPAFPRPAGGIELRPPAPAPARGALRRHYPPRAARGAVRLAQPDDNFAFVGRTSPEKGLDRAIAGES